MTDITLDQITSGYNFGKVNTNFSRIESVINDEVLHLTGGNATMQQDIDMNSQTLINLRQATLGTSPVTLSQLEAAVGGFAQDGRPIFPFTDVDVNVNSSHIGGYIRIDGTTTSLVTFPLESAESIPEGSEFHIASKGTVEVTLFENSAGGQVLNQPTGLSYELGEGGVVTVKKISGDEWDVFGTLETA